MSIGFVFPGQGSQELGMLSDFADDACVLATIAEAEAALDSPLWETVTNGPVETLNRTDVTQPAILTASVALWRLWQARGGAEPIMMAGHSLGEYSALVASGALEFADAVRLVRVRGRLMQRAVPAGQGAMAAILGLDDETVEDVCDTTRGIVTPANYNAPGQVVIAGTGEAVEAAVALCKQEGARRAVMLAVSVPSHCVLMREAADELGEELARVELREPRLGVVHNVDGALAIDADGIRRNLVAQLYQPVRWVDCVRTVAAAGVDRFVECGPGKVLGGLIRRIDKSVHSSSLADTSAFAAALGDAK